jgi:hypothetical protein
VDLPSILRVAAHHERAPDPRGATSVEELGDVGSISEHVRREVWRGLVSSGDQGLAEIDGRLDPVARRGGHRGRRSRRQRLGSLERVPERDQLEQRRSNEPGDRLSLDVRRRCGSTASARQDLHGEQPW